MISLFIFRHGETYFTKHNLDYGDKVVTAEILEEGIPAIKKLARYLKNIKTDQNFSSPFKRCVQTSNIVSEITNKKFIYDKRIQDFDPRVEMIDQLIERLLSFCKDLTISSHKSIAICTHGYPINAIISYFTKGSVNAADLENFPKPGVLATIKDKKVSYKDFN